MLAGAFAPAALAGEPQATTAPVVPGDHPDPSLLRTAGGWYATATSGTWLPGFPILHSADLRDWRQVGSVLMRRPRWAATDFWAPELVRRGGRALVYYAAMSRRGRRCIAVASAARVRGPYRDHGPILCSRIGEIDPLPVRDEQGAEWLIWKRDGNSRHRPTPILAAPLAPGGLSLAAPPVELFRADAAWERRIVEAPALLRRDGTFYLVYSAGRCCGKRCNYATGVARAPSLLGPWEKRPDPILTGGQGIRCPGHAGIAAGPDGEPILAYHAYVRGDPSNRQLLMAPIGFDAAGWPRVARPERVVPQPAATRFGFGAELTPGWSWPSGPPPAHDIQAGKLVLGHGTLARQTGTTRFSARTVVAERRHAARPALALMASDGNTIAIELRGDQAVAWRRDDGRLTALGSIPLEARDRPQPLPARGRPRPVAPPDTELRLTVGAAVELSARSGRRWRSVGGRQPLPRWAGGAHVGLRVGGPAGARAEFDSLSIDPR
jgi:xylan 1,4-beta-xylosidase